MEMTLKIEEGIANWLLGTIVLACAAPAVTLNVWPRIETMMASGTASSNQVGIVLLVTLSALGMTAVPFAMKKAENYGFWLTCLVFGIGLGLLNYTMAVGAVGKARDSESDSKKQIIEKASTLRRAITENEEARRTLPPFKWTSQEMVASASQAVAFAREAQEAECKIVKDICRARIAQLASRQAELADISASRSNTIRAEQLDTQLHSIRSDLGTLGIIPENTDQQASRIAILLGAILTLGPNASERVATGLIHFLAICAEAFALGMPRIIVTALAKGPMEKKDENQSSRIPPAFPTKLETPTMAARVNKIPRKNSTGEVADVEVWRMATLIRTQGKTRDWEAFENYKHWAKAQNLRAETFPDFDRRLQGLGIKKETDSNLQRDFYLDVAIKTPLKAAS